MAGFFALIQMCIYVFIIMTVVRSIKKRNSSMSSSDAGMGNETVRKDYTTQRQVYSSNSNSASGAGRTAAKPATPMRTAATSQPVLEKTDSTVWGADETEGGSVTDYLAEKARLDQISHAEEKREENRRLYEKSGGLQAAERLYEGESVPNGKHCIVCSYCAAENLIPNGSRMRYSCYFCREPLV